MHLDLTSFYVVLHLNLLWAPSHCPALLVFSSVPGQRVCSGRAAWVYPWTHKPPVAIKERHYMFEPHKHIVSQNKRHISKYSPTSAHLRLPVKIHTAALPGENCDLGAWSECVLLVAVQL